MSSDTTAPELARRPAVDFACRPETKWVVVRTRPRCEKKFADFCDKRQIACYLPLRRSIRRYSQRTRVSLVPIFSGYAFGQVSAVEREQVRNCDQVANILVPSDAMELQLVRELQDIQRIESAMLDGEIEVRPEIQVGRVVVIKGGPLAGLSGIVTLRRNKVRLTVNVELVGQCVSVDVDAAEVEIEP